VPTYQYVCTECATDLEAVQSFQDAPLTECPTCGGRLRKRFGAVGVVFKGSGFYRTDSRKGAVTAESDGGEKKSEKADKADKGEKAGATASAGASGSSDGGSSSSGSSGSNGSASSSSESGGGSSGSGSSGSASGSSGAKDRSGSKGAARPSPSAA